jgi:hypothetical protein
MPSQGSNDKQQSSKPELEKDVGSAFKHLKFVCDLDFDIWRLATGIATRSLPLANTRFFAFGSE